MELLEYNIKLKSIPGRENRRADMLSRQPDFDQGEKDNQDVIVLLEEMFIRSRIISYIPEEPLQQDEGIIQQWAGTYDLKKINGEWWKGTCKVITGEKQDKHKIIQAYHDVPAYGHPGINRTKDLVARYYWWLQLTKDVQEYIKGCALCQQNKVNTHPQKAPLSPINPLTEALPFQTIAMDFIIKLPESAGFDSILTITDHDCTKMLIAIPCVTDLSVTIAHKVGPGLQDLQERGQRILAERNAEKAEENTWIGRMVAAENINDMKALIKSCDST